MLQKHKENKKKKNKTTKNNELHEKICKKQLTYMHEGCIVSTVNRS